MSQIITVTFAEGQREAIAAQPLEQWAYGQRLQFEGLDLPQAYRVDFSNFEYCGASIPRVGGPDGVAVPVEVLTSGRNVYAFIWVQDETSGARYRRATVRVVPGPEPDTDESPEEQSAVTEAINALNAAAAAIPEQVNAAVEEAIAKGDFSGAFWAVYGITTGDEIDEALEDGKVVLLENSGLVFQLVGKLPTAPQNTFLFTTFTGDAYFALSVKGTTWSIVGQGTVAHLTSPNFGGTPTAPTAPPGTDNTQIATTEFVAAAIQAALEGFTPGQTISEELKQALLQLARKVAYIDAQGETYYQDLYDALSPPAVLASIRATFAQGSTVIYNTDSLDVLKPLLTVTAVYDDGSTEAVAAEDYALSGALATGISTITASYQGKTATFQVTVTAAPMAFPITNNLTACSTSNSAAAVMENEPYSAVITPAAGYTLTGASVVITMAGSNITASAYSGGVINIAAVTGELVISVAAVAVVLSSITAAYTQSGTVYDTDSLDSLKTDLVVTAAYSDGTSTVLAADAYTLSGTLAAGTSTITVNYQGKSTTFQVVVTVQPVLGSITATYTQSGTVYDTDTLDSLKADLVVTARYSDSSTETVPAADYTLSGTLTAGTSTITVSYGGKTTTFDVTVTEYVETPLYNWDLTQSLTDTEQSAVISTTATFTEGSGLSITQDKYADFGAVYEYDRTYEFTITALNRSNTTSYRRVWMVYKNATSVGTTGWGLIFSSNKGGIQFYCGSWQTAVLATSSITDFEGRFAVYVDANGYPEVYKDGVYLGKSTKAITKNSDHTNVYMGANSGDYTQERLTSYKIYEGKVIN